MGEWNKLLAFRDTKKLLKIDIFSKTHIFFAYSKWAQKPKNKKLTYFI